VLHEWNGDWSETSDLWTQHLDIKTDLGYEKQQEYRDGVFWMRDIDFAHYFRKVYLTE